MALVRIDNRLIHGQIIETWLPHTGASRIIVANDELAGDVLQQEIMSLAIPQSVTTLFVNVEGLAHELDKSPVSNPESILILFSNCSDAKELLTADWFENLNIGNVHYSPGKNRFLQALRCPMKKRGVCVNCPAWAWSLIFDVSPMTPFR